jgi:hypothetical protein
MKLSISGSIVWHARNASLVKYQINDQCRFPKSNYQKHVGQTINDSFVVLMKQAHFCHSRLELRAAPLAGGPPLHSVFSSSLIRSKPKDVDYSFFAGADIDPTRDI